MRESDLYYATRARPGRREPFEVYREPVVRFEVCPGFRARGCGVRLPPDRYLCHFCRRSAELAVGG